MRPTRASARVRGLQRPWIADELFGRLDHGYLAAVEAIPFRETRQYVQNVLSFAVIYAYLDGREVPVVQPAEQLIRNPWPLQAANAR